MIWSIVTGTPRNLNTRTGWGARPGAERMVWLPKMSVVNGGIATDTPMVATTLMSGRASLRRRKRAKYNPMPMTGPATRIDRRRRAKSPNAPGC